MSANGWASVGQALGTLFGGGQARDEQVYRQRMGENAALEQKMASAGQERLRMIGMERIANDPNIDPMTRDLILGGLGSEFSSVSQGRLREQELGFRNDAFTRADAAGYGVNAPLIALSAGPVEFNRALAGGDLQGDTYLPGSKLAMTELGMAEFLKDQTAAQANANRAAASSALADLYSERAANPERFHAPPRSTGTPDGGPTADDFMDALALNAAIREENRRLVREGRPTLPEVPLPQMTQGVAAPSAASATPIPTPGTPSANPASQPALPALKRPQNKQELDQLIAYANEAIAAGRDREQVIAALKAVGVEVE